MNNRKNLYTSLFRSMTFSMGVGFCFVILLSGCSEVIEWNVNDSQSQLVVEGVVTSENKKHYIYLSSTQNVYSEKDIAGISNATITISDGASVYALEEHSERKGFYETTQSFAGEPGKTYQLDIQLAESVGGVQTVRATTVMPHLLIMDSIKVVSETLFGTETYAVKLFGKDPKDTENNYLMYVYRNDTLFSNDLDDLVLFNNEDIEGINFDDFTIYNSDEILEGDSIMVEIQSITGDYYEYLSDLMDLSDGGDPLGFSGPPSNVYGNTGNNTFGYFYAAPISRLEGVAGK